MGSVYLSHTRGGRAVAVKVAKAEFAADPGFRQRFAKQVEVAARVPGLYTAPVVDAFPVALHDDGDGDSESVSTVTELDGRRVHTCLPAPQARLSLGGRLQPDSRQGRPSRRVRRRHRRLDVLRRWRRPLER
jgi:hypothetical protein